MKTFSIGQKAFIVNKSNKVLVIKRSQYIGNDAVWDFPGGRVDWGEALDLALIREVKEEVSLDLKEIHDPLSISTLYNNRDGRNQIVRVIYLCFSNSAIKLSTEHQEFMWIKPGEHKKFNFIGEDYHQSFINFINLKNFNSKVLIPDFVTIK